MAVTSAKAEQPSEAFPDLIPRITLDIAGTMRPDWESVDPDQTQWDQISALLARNDFVAAFAALENAIARPDFGDYPREFRHRIFRLLYSVSAEVGIPAQMLASARQLTAFEGADGSDWIVRISAAVAARDMEDASDSLMMLIPFGSDALSTLKPEFVRDMAMTRVMNLPNGKIRQERLIDALFDVGWDNKASWLWARRVISLLDAGDNDRAAVMLRKVSGSSTRLAISTDRRFDRLRESVPEAFDVDSALALELESARVKAEAANAGLEDASIYAVELMHRGSYEQGLSIIDGALARADVALAASAGTPVVVESNQLIWALDTRSRLLVFLGRHEEAVAALRQAARRPESGHLNVSHAINLGALYNRIDSPEAALDAVADLASTHASPYGRMQLRLVQACAYSALEREAEFTSIVALIREDLNDAPNALLEVAACDGDVDTMAESLVSRLSNPDQRTAALLGVQDWLELPHPTEFDRRKRAAMDTVLAREDVVTAINEVGYRRSWPLTAP